ERARPSGPLSARVVYAPADYSARELILGIYLSLKSLAGASPHNHGTLRRYISLKTRVDYIELSETVGNGYRGCSGVIWEIWGVTWRSQGIARRAHIPVAAVGAREGGCGAQLPIARMAANSKTGFFIWVSSMSLELFGRQMLRRLPHAKC